MEGESATILSVCLIFFHIATSIKILVDSVLSYMFRKVPTYIFLSIINKFVFFPDILRIFDFPSVENHGKRLFNNHSRPVELLILHVIALMCSSNVKDVSNIRPKCFSDETCWTGLLLTKYVGVQLIWPYGWKQLLVLV